MDKLGRRLREAREAKGSTLEEAEDATRIRAHFLESLEAGDFAAFPGGHVQVRGFLRIYARYLDLSTEDVLGRYSSEVDGAEISNSEGVSAGTPSNPGQPPDDLTAIRFRPRDIPVGSSLPRWMNVRTVIVVGLALTFLLAVLALVTYILNQPEDGILLAPLGVAAPTERVPAPTRTPSSVPAQAPPAVPVSVDGRITLALEAREHVQVRVRRDGTLLFEQTMEPGETKTWSDDEPLVVETGNGAALDVTVNGVALGPMGSRGELCTRAWGPQGEIAVQ